MDLDFNNELHDDAVTVSAVGGSIIDTGAQQDNIAVGAEKLGKLQLSVQVKETFTAAAAGTLKVTLQTSNTKSGAAGSEVLSGATDLCSSDAIGKATLVPGYCFALAVDKTKLKRYVGLYFTVATGPMTAGSIWAGLVYDLQTN